MNERVLYEAERWFRAKLRGETPLHPHEADLFRALVERQNSRVDTYLSKETVTLRPPRPTEPEQLAATMPPPPHVHEELLRISKGAVGPTRTQGEKS